jgi:Tfp pilus assembly protein PilF
MGLIAQSLKTDPNIAQSHIDMAIGLNNAHDLNGAAENLQEAIALQPNNPQTRSYLQIVLKERAAAGMGPISNE